jgi:hypothetical protein
MSTPYTKQLVSFAMCTEVGNFVQVVEASTLGLRPGEWPATLQCEPAFGNGRPLIRGDMERSSDGELVAVNYRQMFGVIGLRVFND